VITVDVQVATDPTTAVGEYGFTLTGDLAERDARPRLGRPHGGDQGAVGRAPHARRGAQARRPGDAVVYRFNVTNIARPDDIVVQATKSSPDPDWG